MDPNKIRQLCEALTLIVQTILLSKGQEIES